MAIALSLGSLFYGPLDRIFNTRKWVIFFGNAVVVVAAAWLAIAPPVDPWMAGALLVVIGLFGTSYAVQLAHVMGFIPTHLAGRGVTLMNFFAIGGVGVMQLVSGATYEAFSLASGTDAAFSALFSLYSISLGFALLVYLFSQDSRPGRV